MERRFRIRALEPALPLGDSAIEFLQLMGVVGRRRLAERLLCVPRLRTLDARVPAPLDALYWAALGLEERRGKLERVAPIAPVADFRDAFARACPN